MKDEYDPEFDSPEARANFATRHIFNLVARKRKRDELLAKFRSEPVVDMFPGRTARGDIERIKTEFVWFKTQRLKKHEHVEICQCGTEKLIQRSTDSKRMRATLLSLVFFDQFVRAHYPEVHDAFRAEFPSPKLIHHFHYDSASPSWFVYSTDGDDKQTDWELVSEIFVGCVQHLRHWLREHLGRPVPELKGKVEMEVRCKFEQEHYEHFVVPIGA